MLTGMQAQGFEGGRFRGGHPSSRIYDARHACIESAACQCRVDASSFVRLVRDYQAGNVRFSRFQQRPKPCVKVRRDGGADGRPRRQRLSPRGDFRLAAKDAEISDAVEDVEIAEHRTEYRVHQRERAVCRTGGSTHRAGPLAARAHNPGFVIATSAKRCCWMQKSD